MTNDELTRLREIAPGKRDEPALFTDAERLTLLAEAMTDDRRPRRQWRPAPSSRWLIPLAGAAAAASAIATAIAIAVGGPSAAPIGSHGTTGPASAGAHGAAPRVRTVAYVSKHVSAAIANASGALRVVQSDPDGGTVDVTEDLSSGASLITVLGADGSTLQQASTTSSGRPRTSIFIDFGSQSWWTNHAPIADYSEIASNPQLLRRWLTLGIATVAGQDVINGQQAIHLKIEPEFTLHGKQYATSISDVWVSADTFLPLREIGNASKFSEDFTWSAQPPTPAEVTAVPPAGFTQLSGPPPYSGGGQG